MTTYSVSAVLVPKDSMNRTALIPFVAVMAGLSQATVINIDTFGETDASAYTVATTPTSNGAVDTRASAFTIGGNRTTFALVTNRTGRGSFSDDIGDGMFVSQLPTTATGFFELDYATGGMDFGSNRIIRLNDVDNEKTVTLTAGLFDHDGRQSMGTIVVGAYTGILDINLVDDAGFDSAHVDYAYVRGELSKAGDIQFGSIQSVPEPASMASLALGVVAVLRRRKRA